MDLLIGRLESTSDRLAPVSWQGVRTEYFKVWADFPLIAQPFEIRLSQQQLDSLGHMLVAMDLIDSAIDGLSDMNMRQDVCRSVLNWMRRTTDPFSLDDYVDTVRLEPLREIIQRTRIEDEFLQSAANVFHASERKRHATTSGELVSHLLCEGQSAAEMTIAILGSNTNRRFNNFLERVMRIGTIVDTLLDAEDDFESGILLQAPTLLFRLHLRISIGRQLPGLILSFPNRRLLWKYCLSYTRSELKALNPSLRPDN